MKNLFIFNNAARMGGGGGKSLTHKDLRRHSRRLSGFTLVKLLVVIAVVVAIAVSGYAGYLFWSYAPWITIHKLPVFDYSHDRIIDWEKELGEITIPDAAIDWKKSRTYTHALGRIDQDIYTNSKEAFVANYKRGARVFEVDLTLTDDGRLVCNHGRINLPTGNRTFLGFMQTKIRNRYTPLSFRDLAMMMKLCPDVFIITDTKKDRPHLVRQAFAALVADAKSVDETILDRVIPQLYAPSMLNEIEKIHSFKEYMFTRYKRGTWECYIIDLIERHPNVVAVTFPKEKVPPSFCEYLKARNVRTYTHTVDSIDEMKRYVTLGIEGFCSNDLTDTDVRQSGIFDTDCP